MLTTLGPWVTASVNLSVKTPVSGVPFWPLTAPWMNVSVNRPLAVLPGAGVIVIGKEMIVGNVALSTPIGAPTVTVDPFGPATSVFPETCRRLMLTSCNEADREDRRNRRDRRATTRRDGADLENLRRLEGRDDVDQAEIDPRTPDYHGSAV